MQNPLLYGDKGFFVVVVVVDIFYLRYNNDVSFLLQVLHTIPRFSRMSEVKRYSMRYVIQLLSIKYASVDSMDIYWGLYENSRQTAP